MGKEIVLFKSEERMDLQSVSAFLHQLADKLAQNQVILRQGEEEIIVAIPDNVVLELKVETEVKKGKTERCLEVEIEWIEGDQSGGLITLG
jgi:amphi-Trp domain-containing protein